MLRRNRSLRRKGEAAAFGERGGTAYGERGGTAYGRGGVKKGMLVLVLLPEATGEEDENGENLKTSYEHEEGAYPLHSDT